MIKIMFVCHGNICRSPMAEFIFKSMVQKLGKEDVFFVSSCATSTEEIWNGVGNPVYPPARDELSKHGISCIGKRAVRLRAEDYPEYDYFIGMDNANIRNMQRMLGGDPENKIHRLMDFTAEKGEVTDPWYSGRFDIAYRDIYNGCKGLLEELIKKAEL